MKDETPLPGETAPAPREEALPADFPYRDIWNRERPPYTRHPPMPLEARAAQFASFDALDGFKQTIRKTGDAHQPLDDLHWEAEEDLFL